MPELSLLKVACQPAEAVLHQLDSTELGLSSVQAAKNQLQYGHNQLSAQTLKWWEILLRQIKSPFIYILVFAAVLAYFLGETLDASMIVLFVCINATLGFFQEYRSEQALRVLQKYTVSHTQVFRDGRQETIETTELVPGDVIQLEPGDIVPADGRIIADHNVLVDESVLTGESVPVEKSCQPMTNSPTEMCDATCVLFSGTSVLRGSAKMVVVTIGKETYVGKITKLTVETHHQSSFEKGMQSFSSFVLKIVFITLSFLFVANVLLKPDTTNILELLIFSIALATAVIPEALPLVITFSLSRGALRLAKHKVVVKRLSAIEDLGGIQVLCTDKTGTITRNILTVSDLFAQGGPSHDEQVFLTAALGSFGKAGKQDPFDLAIAEAAHKRGIALPSVRYLSEIPFDPQRRRSSVLIENISSERKTLIVRGALESVLPFCNNVIKTQHKQLLEWADQQGKLGRRVISIARRPYQHLATADYSAETEEKHLEFVGCLAFADPLKTTASAAIEKAKRLGVQVKILTGDGSAVAGAVAQEVGLIESIDEVITGSQFEELKPAQQRQAIEKYHVFARVSPQQKFAIIELLQEHYEVGYLGEGINDAPALKVANVSLAVQEASDIAKETADVILLNPSLRVIIDGIQEGREVFANTIKYVKLTMSSNFGNFFTVGVAALFINYLPMLPVQILLVNLLTDFPLVAVAADSVDPAETLQPERYDLRDFALISIFFGLVSSLFDFLFFGFFSRISAATLQTNWFIGSILCELILFFSLRTKLPFFKAKRPATIVVILMCIASVVTLLLPISEFGHRVFHFETPTIEYMTLTVTLVFAYFVTNEVVKLFYYRVFERQPALIKKSKIRIGTT